MATEPLSPPVSQAKFAPLIIQALTEGPKKVKEIYAIALERQPGDCPNVPCTHRKKVGNSMEWQHDIQRQLARVATNRDGYWSLKSAAPVTMPTPTTPEPTAVGTVIPTIAEPEKPYTGDPFIVTESGHYMDAEELKKPEKERFRVPRDFDEFYAWEPKYILNWVKRRLNKFVVDEDVEDWTQDLIIHMKYLPANSKHRLPGANGRANGCTDVIQTFDPIQQYGASVRRFRNYVNFCLANKFNTVQSKRQKNPVLRPGTIPYGLTDPETEGHNTGDEFVHANSSWLAAKSDTVEKQQHDRMRTSEFKRFVEVEDPSVIQAIEAIEATGTIGEAAKFMGVSDGEFTRLRNRLKQLATCFEEGIPVPKQRRPYKKRTTTLTAAEPEETTQTEVPTN